MSLRESGGELRQFDVAYFAARIEEVMARRTYDRVVVLQSNYLPWRGYFDLISNCDAFVFLDNVQFTKNDWRNRNKIKSKKGSTWLSLPVRYRFSEKPRISDIQVSDRHWSRSHLDKVKTSYMEAAHFDEVFDWFSSQLEAIKDLPGLSEINQFLIEKFSERLKLKTDYFQSTDLVPLVQLDKASPSQAVLNICEALNAKTYISGPAAKDYLEERIFEKAEIDIRYADYSDYPEYPQLHPPFDGRVSDLDMFFNTGVEAPKYLKKEKLLP
jgi:hypothetical protein